MRLLGRILRSLNQPQFSPQKTIVTLITIFCLMSCGTSKKPDDGDDPAVPEPAKGCDDHTIGWPSAKSQQSSRGLAFVGTDLSYTSSTLFFLDSATEAQTALLPGESGDAAVFQLGSVLYLFNRTATSYNFRTVDPAAGPSSASKQVALGVGQTGDPSDVIATPDGKLLTALGVAGDLAVIDGVSGQRNQDALASSLTQTLDFVPTGATDPSLYPFRPAALQQILYKDKCLTAVVHQGLDKNYAQSGVARIFLLESSTTGSEETTATQFKWNAVDQDSGSEKVQGINLPYPNPSKLLPLLNLRGEKNYAALSLCSAFGGSDSPCQQGIAFLDPATGTVTNVWDLSSEPIRNNGSVEVGPNGAVIFAGVQFIDGEHTGKKAVIALKPEEKSYQIIHEFPAASSGCCGNVTYLHDKQQLWIADETTSGAGFFTIYDYTSPNPKLLRRIDTAMAPRGSLTIATTP